MMLLWCERHSYRAGRRLTVTAPQELHADGVRWRVARSAPDPRPAGSELRELVHAIGRALALSGPGDLLYFPESCCRHEPGAPDAVVDGLTRTDADYVALHDDLCDYWPGGGAGPVPGSAVLSAAHVWHRRRRLARSFGCRRGVLVRDHDILLERLGGTGRTVAWDEIWAALVRRGRVLRTVLPALASPAAPGESAPSGPGESRMAETGAAPPSAVMESDFWRRHPPDRIAVLPTVSASFCAELARLCPRSRLTPVPVLDRIDAEGYTCVAATVGDKERLDDHLRFRRHRVDAVLVELSDTDPGRTVRWVSGRDWLVPAVAATASPWIV